MRKTLILLSKNILVKLLVIIIIGVFALWGIGDMFSGGKNNVIVEISGKKIYAQEFGDELRKEMIIQNISNGKDVLKQNLHLKVLNNIISNKIIELYAEEKGVIINDQALANFLKNIPEFQDKDQFSRTKYEKYLLQNNLTSSEFEKNYKKNLLRQIIIDSQIKGVSSTEYHAKIIKDYFSKQAAIKYLDLNNIYKKYIPNEEEIKIYHDKNPLYTNELRSIKFSILELKNFENEELFFSKISNIENLVLSNKTFQEIVDQQNLNIKTSANFDINGINNNGKKEFNEKQVIEKTFKLNNQIHTDFFEISGKFYLITIDKIIPKKIMPLDEANKKKIIDIIASQTIQISIDKIKSNPNNKKIFREYFETNNKNVKKLFINSRFDKNLIFKSNEIEKILSLNNNDFLIIQNTKNYLINIEKISYNNNQINNEMSQLFQRQVVKNFQDQILISFDKFLNKKYKIEINQKVLDRITKSF